MPIIETAVAKCDVCGDMTQLPTYVTSSGDTGTRYPPGWQILQRDKFTLTEQYLGCELKCVCPRHAIQVTNNGDVVTLVKGIE